MTESPNSKPILFQTHKNHQNMNKMKLANKAFSLQEKLVELLQVKESPCISIIKQNDNPSINNEKLRIEVKNGVKAAVEELEKQDYDKRLIKKLEERMMALEESVQYNNYLRGVGLFVSANVAEVLYFPMEVKPKVIVDDSFEIRDLLLQVNRTFQYDVLVLSKKKTRFFNGFGKDLQEVLDSDIPKGAEDFLKRENKAGTDPAKTESIALEKYARELDHFLRLHAPMQMPLILMGDVKLLGYFRKYAKRPTKIIGEIEGSYDDMRVSEISEKINEQLREFSEKWEDQLLAAIQDDIDRLRYAAGIQEVWQAAAMKEARMLLTEHGYRVEGYSTKDGLFFVFDPEFAPDGDFHEDAIDDLAEMVLAQGGESYFLAPGKLEKFDKVLLTTRF